MTTHEFEKRIQLFLHDQEHLYLAETLRRMSEMFLSLSDDMVAFFAARTTTDADKKPLERISEMTNELRELSPQRLFLQIASLKSLIYDLGLWRTAIFFMAPEEVAPESGSRGNLNLPLSDQPNIALLDRFASSYERHLQRSSVHTLYTTIGNAYIAQTILKTVCDVLEDIVEELAEGQASVGEGERTLEISLNRVGTLEEFTEKLKSLLAIYLEYCRLFDISAAEYPLKIIKVETGSLWLKVFGESKIIGLVTDSLKAAAAYYYRKLTTEGKLGSIPARVEGLESVLHLAEELKDAGYNIPEMEENIAKTATLIAKHQAKLLENEFRITIGGDEFSASSSFDQMVLHRTTTPLLESKPTPLLNEENSEED